MRTLQSRKHMNRSIDLAPDAVRTTQPAQDLDPLLPCEGQPKRTGPSTISIMGGLGIAAIPSMPALLQTTSPIERQA